MTPAEMARQAREAFARKRAAYNDTLTTDMAVIVSKWKLIRLCLHALVSPRPAYRLLFKGGRGDLHPAAHIVLKDLEHVSRFTRGALVISPVTRMTDSHATAYRDGMRDLYIRIRMMADLDGGITEDYSDAD